ncbi:MAG: sodium-dependent transporter [Gemmatimonadota bacterium]|nr:sodium-dependent transporter [Gemmatimonadota bacterium]MDE3004996.1 sodium-dependent transporter [Gemmatimonadota bacterium]MDE3014996.1 sodium-dependent transporter [Gemmatimonadota bacterium]
MTEQRGNWTSSAGFVLAATGSAIGLGNLWKFPFITWENNGGAFVLVYLVCIAAVGLPIMMAELLVGRKTQKSAVGALKEAAGPAWGLVGLWGVLCGFTLLSYYTVIAGWSLFYFVQTIGWTASGFPAGLATGDLFGEQVSNAPLQLMMSLGFSIATVSVVYFGVQRGIERIARLFLPILFAILVLMLVSALGMSGAGEAIAFIFRPSFSELEPVGVLEALGHSFFTLSLGMGAMITYGSYIARNQSLVKAAGTIVLLDTVIALVATVIMFSVIFSVAGMAEQVGGSTVGMLFISLPELFYTEVPFGIILGPLFYVLVALAALTSTMSLLEVVTSYVIDEHGIERHKATVMCGSAVFVFTIFAALSFSDVPFLSTLAVFEGKTGWFETADHFVSNWMLPTGGLAITIAVGWFMTREQSESELVDETTPGWFSYGVWRFFIRYVAPVAVAAIVIAVLRGTDFS